MFIECPSGLSGEIRRFKVSDYDLFGDKSLARKKGPQVSATICKRLWENTVSPGPYEMDDDGNPQWFKDVMEHDRFFILMQARIMARGPKYTQRFKCEFDSCGRFTMWEIDLNELEIKKAADDVIDAFQSGNQFEVILPRCQETVVFELPTFEVQKRVDAEVQKNGKRLSSVYAGRIKRIGEQTIRSQIWRFVRDLDAEDWEALDEAFDDVDFGVNTAIEYVCGDDDCALEQTQELILGRDFFIGGR